MNDHKSKASYKEHQDWAFNYVFTHSTKPTFMLCCCISAKLLIFKCLVSLSMNEYKRLSKSSQRLQKHCDAHLYIFSIYCHV